jgi:hypothetical protein
VGSVTSAHASFRFVSVTLALGRRSPFGGPRHRRWRSLPSAAAAANQYPAPHRAGHYHHCGAELCRAESGEQDPVRPRHTPQRQQRDEVDRPPPTTATNAVISSGPRRSSHTLLPFHSQQHMYPPLRIHWYRHATSMAAYRARVSLIFWQAFRACGRLATHRFPSSRLSHIPRASRTGCRRARAPPGDRLQPVL